MATLIAPCAFPFDLGLLTPLCWHRERRPRRPACTFGDSLIDRTLFLDLLSTLPVSFYLLLVRFTLKPWALTLCAGTTDDSRRRAEYIPQTSTLSIPSLVRLPPLHTPTT